MNSFWIFLIFDLKSLSGIYIRSRPDSGLGSGSWTYLFQAFQSSIQFIDSCISNIFNFLWYISSVTFQFCYKRFNKIFHWRFNFWSVITGSIFRHVISESERFNRRMISIEQPVPSVWTFWIFNFIPSFSSSNEELKIRIVSEILFKKSSFIWDLKISLTRW